ncbi:site-specific integrase [Ralstonia wenshanensis]|uniref:integrase n=1 Tax=Ralstonia wenshanensis TaxID=2842456 RepID=UPI002AAE3EB5|nr:integrase [Ralstonia wenshanensis]MDY7508796.1 integrase [Ralstonia wenshanensis]
MTDLSPLSAADIHETPVSQRGGTVLSRYRDDLWDLAPYLPARNLKQTTIHFKLRFADGSHLTDPQHSALLNASKRFLYTRWRTKAPHSRKHIAARTVLNNWSQLRALLKWMVEHRIGSFSSLTSERCLQYAADQVGRLKDSTRVINLQILTTYYDLRDHLTDRLPEYPWSDSVPSILVRAHSAIQRRGDRQATTEVIPIRILRSLVQTALEYVENRANHILQLRDEILRIRKEAYEKQELAHRAKYPRKFSSIYKDEATYLGIKVTHTISNKANSLCFEKGFRSLIEFKSQLIYLRTACHIICAVFSGMRDSELASLEVGCFAKREGYDGEDFCWLQGLTYKLEENPTRSEWMVPEVVGVAVEVATRLGEPGRALCAARIQEIKALLSNTTTLRASHPELLTELDEARKHQHALIFSGKRIGRILALGGAASNASLRAFAMMAGAIVRQSDMEGVIDRTKVHVGRPWPLTQHQFRRTFAVLVARNLMGDVRYLREHFKHWSIDMTLYYAKHDASMDVGLFSDILTERDELQALILEKWIATDTPLSGGGGKRIVTFRNRGDIKTVKDMREFCRRLGEDVFIRGTGHSWCMANGNGCGGQGLYDAVRCVSCSEGVVDKNHLHIWRGIRQQQIETLQCPDLGTPSWERCVEHLRESERILKELGDAVTPYPAPKPPHNLGQ